MQPKKHEILTIPPKSQELKNSPLLFVSNWDFLLVFLAATVRLFISMKYKAREVDKKKGVFCIKKYFDSKHVLRWIGHYFTGFVLLLVLPEIFLAFLGPKYFPEFSAWSFSADFIIGFLGYDLVKSMESLTLLMIKKYIKSRKL